MWSCLTCGTCDQRCPSTVDFTGFMRQIRRKARQAGESGACTHAETIEAIGVLQLSPGYSRSASWLGSGPKTSRRGRDYYFAGCLPFLDVVFRDLGFDGRAIGRAAVRILNRLGIVPAMSDREVCCGHDRYWTGDMDTVRILARRNVEAIKRTGARRVIFSCPEGYHMFKRVYPRLMRDPDLEPVLLMDLMDEDSGKIRPRARSEKITYQDPCRLARAEEVIDLPRRLLGLVPDLDLVEMGRVGRDAVCCGSSGWVSCSRVNKKIQVERLNEALETGAGTLVTACPKCNIHLRCAMRDEDCTGRIEITDLFTILAESPGGGKRGT
jgi:Fe-S oxidoreductase